MPVYHCRHCVGPSVRAKFLFDRDELDQGWNAHPLSHRTQVVSTANVRADSLLQVCEVFP